MRPPFPPLPPAQPPCPQCQQTRWQPWAFQEPTCAQCGSPYPAGTLVPAITREEP